MENDADQPQPEETPVKKEKAPDLGPEFDVIAKQPPKGTYKPRKPGMPKRLYVKGEDLDKLVEQCATAIVADESVRHGARRKGPPLAAMNEADREAINRALGVPADEFQKLINMKLEKFNEKLSARLAELSGLLVEGMKEAVIKRKFSPDKMAFALAITEDKRARLDGRSQINNASVNIAITQYCGSDPNFDREKLLAEISGQKLMADDPIINVTPPKPEEP